MTFPELLRTYRTRAGLSQGALSRQANMSYASVSCYESGKRRPSRDAVLRLARALAPPPRETAGFLAAAGYGTTDETLVALSVALGDPSVPEETRRAARQVLETVLANLEGIATGKGG